MSGQLSQASALAAAKNHGSAKSGTIHWWWQRLTAISNLILSGWFVCSLVALPDFSYPTLRQAYASPVCAGLLGVFGLSIIVHMRLGLQVVIEDYVHHKGLKLFKLVMLNLYTAVLVGILMLSMIKLVAPL